MTNTKDGARISQLIKDNADEFQNAEQLTDFLDNYTNTEGSDVREQEDNISEYADGLVPIYYSDQVKEWQENPDARGMADEQGLLEETKDPYKIMSLDLYCWYEQQLREDYNKLIELMDEEEEIEDENEANKSESESQN